MLNRIIQGCFRVIFYQILVRPLSKYAAKIIMGLLLGWGVTALLVSLKF